MARNNVVSGKDFYVDLGPGRRQEVTAHIKGMQRLAEPLEAQEAQVVEEAGTDLVPTANQEIALTQVLHIGTRFASSARRASAEIAFKHRVTWFTGNNKARTLDGKPLPDIAGWGVEQPDLETEASLEDFALMDAMEILVAQRLAAEVVVQHFDDAGKPRPVKYWALPRASLFVVCEGVPSRAEMMKDPAARWGVAYAWPEGKKSELHLVAYVKELMDAGYNSPFVIKFSSSVTDRMLACLKVHERVLDFADNMRMDAGEDMPLPYYAYALPLVTSKNTMTMGKVQGQTKEVFYPMPVLPPRLSEEYLAAVAITEDQAAIIEDGDRIAETVKWSVEKSKRILEGKADADDDLPGMYHPF